MSKLKTLLREAPLRAPSPALARRVAEALDAADARAARRPWWRLGVPLWACIVAAVVCGLGGFAASRRLAPKPPAIVYIVPAEGELKRILMGEAPPTATPPPTFEVRLLSKEEL